MNTFKVQFETIGWVRGRKNFRQLAINGGLTESFCGGFNDQSRQEDEFPEGVSGVVGGYITEDDNNGSTNNCDIKVFVVITLLIETETAAKAEAFFPPTDLLTKLADVIGTINDKCLLSLDDCWEVTDVEEAPACVPAL